MKEPMSKYKIKEITKIILYDRKTGKVILEAKPTIQPLTMTVTNRNEEK